MKWYGVIGFIETEETKRGVWAPSVTEKHYYGDVIKNLRRLKETNDGINDDIDISVEISIVADPYANDHIYAMRYIEFQGAKWKVTSAIPEFPRITLSIGGLYNE